MNIQGDKVILRSISMKDADLLINMLNDPETEKMLGGWSFPVSIEEQKNWITAQNGRTDVLRCIIALKENEEIGLGTIILSDIDLKNGAAQVHIKMDKQQGRSKGYGTDALNAIVNYSFNEMRMNCIYANVLEHNIVSQKLFEKCGFLREGILRKRVFKCGSYINVISYSRLKEEQKC
ncbi:MAG: GNAT family N-acetyltransferase [Eubacterium sp.]|nr:GNAT family N-acetyltransferase [Eubacterium sp.]